MESEGCRSCSSTYLLGSVCLAGDFDDDDDSEDEYRSINDLIEKAYVPLPPPPSSCSPWRPSRFEDSTNPIRAYLETKLICVTPSGPLPMANRLSPPLGGASMRDRLSPPGAAQVNASVPCLLDLPIRTGMEIPMESFPLDYSLDMQTDKTLVGASVDALRPPHRIRGLCHELMAPLSKHLSSPATQLSSATEFTTELCASTPPVCADPPHPPRLSSQKLVMSMTPSPVPPPARFGRVGASFSSGYRAAVFDQPAMSAPPSLTRSSYIGSLLQSTYEPMSFGSSAPGLFGVALQQQQQQQQHGRQKRMATLNSAVGKLTHINEVLYLINIQVD